MKTEEQSKFRVQLYSAVGLILLGAALLIAGFSVDPIGVISGSVLTGVGEVFTFAGSLLGLDYHYKYKHRVLDKKHESKKRQ